MPLALEGVAIARDMLSAVREMVQGAQIAAPLRPLLLRR